MLKASVLVKAQQRDSPERVLIAVQLNAHRQVNVSNGAPENMKWGKNWKQQATWKPMMNSILMELHGQVLPLSSSDLLEPSCLKFSRVPFLAGKEGVSKRKWEAAITVKNIFVP